MPGNFETFTDRELAHYSRHLSLRDVGPEGQARLKGASVLLIGLGGLGSPMAMYLAAAGVGRIGIVEFDDRFEASFKVETHNHPTAISPFPGAATGSGGEIRDEGATGATVLNQARGEGLSPTKTFLGLSIGNQVDVILMLVEEHLSRHVLERIAQVGKFDETPGTGITFQVDVEDAIGVMRQAEELAEIVEEQL
mgnify:CR=1 FL=1